MIVAPPVRPSNPGLGVTRIPLAEALALGPEAWEPLEASAASPSPFMSWAWHRAWSEAAPPDEVAASETFALRGTDGRLHALLPLLSRRILFHRVQINALTWATGDMGCPDHVDVLAMPGSGMAALADALATSSWDAVVLGNLSPNAGVTGSLSEAMAARGYEVRRRQLWVCPYLDLPEDWDGYLASLSSTRRQTLRRKERQLARQHAFTVTDYTGDRVADGLTHLFSLHARRWSNAEQGGEVGGGGALADPSVQRLHRRFAAELAAGGKLWLATLDIAGKPVAAWYGFAWRDTVYFYQSGRDPSWERHSVGLVLMGVMIRRAIERRFSRFDFLRGADDYKRQWTGAQRTTEELLVFRPGVAGRLLRFLDTLSAWRGRWRRRPTPDRWD